MAPRGYGAKVAMSQALAGADEAAKWFVCPQTSAASDEWDELQDAVRMDAGGWLVLTGITSARVAATRLPALVSSIPADSRLALLAETNLTHLAALHPRSVVLDRGDLAFTQDEATMLLLDLAGDADPEEVRDVVELCGGWATALATAASQLRRGERGSTRAWLASRGAAAIVGPWLSSVDARSSRFLRATTLLADLQPDLCNIVLDAEDSAEILLDLERDEGLLERVKVNRLPSPVWHRHPLLTLALQARGLNSDHTRGAHRRAASWYRAYDDVESALHHYASAGLAAEAGAYLQEHERDLLVGGAADKALDWYERLPADAWDEFAHRELRLAWGRLLSGDTAGARDSLARLTDLLAAAKNGAGEVAEADELEGERCFLAAYLAAHSGNPAEVVHQAGRACELFGNSSGQDSHVLAPTLLARGLIWSGRLVSARRVLDEIDPLRFPSGNLREVSLAGVRALCEVGEGRIVHASASLRGGQRWLRYIKADPLTLGQFTFANAEAALAIERGALSDAAARASEVEAAALNRGDLGEATMARLIRARSCYHSGDLAAAMATVAFARSELLSETPASDMGRLLDEFEINCRIRAGDAVGAESMLARWPQSDGRTLLAARLTVARKPAQTVRALSGLRPQTVRGVVTKQLLLALANRTLNKRLASAHLSEATVVATDNGLTTPLLEFPGLAELDDEWPPAMGRVPWSNAPPSRTAEAESTTSQGLPAVGPVQLSAGELEILSLLPARMTYGQLAAHLGVSVNTLKTRLQRLYRKLGVTRSYDAVAAGRRRGLIRPAADR